MLKSVSHCHRQRSSSISTTSSSNTPDNALALPRPLSMPSSEPISNSANPSSSSSCTNRTSPNPFTAQTSLLVSIHHHSPDLIHPLPIKKRSLLPTASNSSTTSGSVHGTTAPLLSQTTNKNHHPITENHLHIWQSMTQAMRDQITMRGFTEQHKLDLYKWRFYINRCGTLSSEGQFLLDKKLGIQYRKVTAEDVQAWLNMTPSERQKITFVGFARARQLNPRRWQTCITRNGRIKPTGQTILDQAKSLKYQKITANHIHTWCNMTQIERRQISLSGFAKKHQLSASTWHVCVNLNGSLKNHGQAILEKAGFTPHIKISAEHIQTWRNMTQNERQEITLLGFAKTQQLNIHRWQKCVTQSGKLKYVGQTILDKANALEYKKITADHIRTWCNMTQIERKQISPVGFAKQNQLSTSTWNACVRLNGTPKLYGQKILDKTDFPKYNKVRAEHIRAWRDMTEAERTQTSLNDFAKTHHINIFRLQQYINAEGKIHVYGQRLLEKSKTPTYQKVTAADVQAWRDIKSNQATYFSSIGFTKTRHFDPSAFKSSICADEQLSFKEQHIPTRNRDKTLTPPHSPQTTSTNTITNSSTSIATDTLTHTIAIKNELDLNLLPASTQSFPVQAITHEINNNAPILQDHLTGQSITGPSAHLPISSLTWSPLKPFLNALSQTQQREIKHHILQQAKAWIDSEGHHQQLFDDMLLQVRIIDDSNARGTSILAKKSIPPFTVIGPYSGTLLPDQNALTQWESLHGANNVQTYLYQAGPSKGLYCDRTISAFRSGNMLSLINDAELTEPIINSQGQILKNNLISIRIDNKIFLISTQEIAAEEELFLDYGEEYRHHFLKTQALQRQIQSIKTEDSTS